MRPAVDEDLCIGCGNCEDECPEVFRIMDDDGLSHVISEHPGPELFDCIRNAADACPVDAISIGQ